jgi:hypothetical protein
LQCLDQKEIAAIIARGVGEKRMDLTAPPPPSSSGSRTGDALPAVFASRVGWEGQAPGPQSRSAGGTAGSIERSVLINKYRPIVTGGKMVCLYSNDMEVGNLSEFKSKGDGMLAYLMFFLLGFLVGVGTCIFISQKE